jgi:hypothetical protein
MKKRSFWRKIWILLKWNWRTANTPDDFDEQMMGLEPKGKKHE